MDKLTVGQLKQQLEKFIAILDDYDDDNEVETVTSTYFIHSQYFMQFGRIGFVDLENLEDNIKTEDYEENEDDED